MKRLVYTILAVVLLTSATLKVSAQSEQTRPVSGFNSISSGGSFSVHVKIDGTESLKLIADEKIINEIETVVEEGKLKIRFKQHQNWDTYNIGKIDVYVTAKALSALTNSGSGSIKVDGVLSGDKVNLTLSGSGNITSSVKSTDLSASISGSGSINLNGSADNTKVMISGSGGVLGKEFKTASASVTITGSGNVHLGADKNISAHIVGSGSVIYSGNATVESSTIGSGRVSKED